MTESELVWRSSLEERAYNKLLDIQMAADQFGLPDASNAIKFLLKLRSKYNKWNWGVFEDSMEILTTDLKNAHETFSDGFDLLDMIIHNLFEIKRKKGKVAIKFCNLMEEEETIRIKQTLGPITEKINNLLKMESIETHIETIALLIAYSHILRYETRAGFVKRKLTQLMEDSNSTPKASRNPLVERYMTIYKQGIDGKSDTSHIRNSFAHAHFEFLGNQQIHLWDTDKDGNKTYDETLVVQDLFIISELFEKKLILIEIIISIKCIMEMLYRDYSDEWKTFKR